LVGVAACDGAAFAGISVMMKCSPVSLLR